MLYKQKLQHTRRVSMLFTALYYEIHLQGQRHVHSFLVQVCVIQSNNVDIVYSTSSLGRFLLYVYCWSTHLVTWTHYRRLHTSMQLFTSGSLVSNSFSVDLLQYETMSRHNHSSFTRMSHKIHKFKHIWNSIFIYLVYDDHNLENSSIRRITVCLGQLEII